jgi:hypothetical protein
LFAEITGRHAALIVTSALMKDTEYFSEKSKIQPSFTRCYYPKGEATLVEHMMLDYMDINDNCKLCFEFNVLANTDTVSGKGT